MSTELVPHTGPVALQGAQARTADVATGHHARETDQDRLAARLALIAELHLQGYTYREIGSTVGISKSQVGREIIKARALWAERTTAAIDQRIAEEEAKLDYLEQAWLRTAREDKQAAQLVLAFMDRRAKLHGWDKPAQVKVEYVDVTAAHERGRELLDEVAAQRTKRTG